MGFLLPKLTSLIYSSIFPILIALYIFIDRGVSSAVNNPDVDYFTFAESALGAIIISQSWQLWVTRALDFVLWGVIGGVLLLVFWIISASRVAIHNHKAQEEFVHFKVSRSSWHGHFLTVAVAKLILLVILAYLLVVLLFVALPFFIESVAFIVYDTASASVLALGISFVAMLALQYLLMLGVKLFRAIHVDE